MYFSIVYQLYVKSCAVIGHNYYKLDQFPTQKLLHYTYGVSLMKQLQAQYVSMPCSAVACDNYLKKTEEYNTLHDGYFLPVYIATTTKNYIN